MMFKKPKNVGRMPDFKIAKPARIFRDTDRDLTPNMIDCNPRNPRKQGVVSWIKEKAQAADTRLKEYNSPEAREERHQRKLEGLMRKQEIAKARGRLTEVRTKTQSERLGLQKQRLQVQTQRQTLMAARQKMMPSMTGGLTGAAPSIMTPMPGLGEAPKVKKPRKRRKKSSKSKTIVIRTG